MKKLLITTFLCFSLSACTWVELAPEAEKVVVLNTDEVNKCEELGTTTVSVKYEVGGFNRNTETMTNELQTLARNSAVELKGDAIVAVSEIEKGAQKYKIYRCRPQ
jgi:hypothetical protein